MGAIDRIAQVLTRGIKAFHSSPHDFNAFDASKIGTGEGAQVYGHGLYFAENPEVSGQGGQYWKQFTGRFPEAEQHAANRLQAAGWDRAKALEAAQRDAADWDKMLAEARPDQVKYFGQMRDLRQQEVGLLQSGNPVGPRTYEVNINADPSAMLNWDKPIGEQPQLVDKIADLAAERRLPMGNSITGEGAYGSLMSTYMPSMSRPAAREATSIDLRSMGIPGIQYLDQGSRGNSALFPTSNYVVFDPSIVHIDKKYGVPGLLAAGVAGASAANGMGDTVDPSQYDETQ